jgi:hypothetical protein
MVIEIKIVLRYLSITHSQIGKFKAKVMEFSQRIIGVFVLLTFYFSGHSQIESGKVQKPIEREKKVKKAKTKPLISDAIPETSLYASLGYGSSFRALKTNEGVFGEPLGTRANEVALLTPMFELGVRSQLKNNLFLQFGLSTNNVGEQYRFEEMDSVYAYSSRYNSIALPISVQFVKGKKVRFIGGIGLQPQLFLNSKQEITIVNSSNVETITDSETKAGFNTFTISAFTQIGVEWQFSSAAALTLVPTYKLQLNNTLDKQQPYIHRSTWLGANFGISLRL